MGNIWIASHFPSSLLHSLQLNKTVSSNWVPWYVYTKNPRVEVYQSVTRSVTPSGLLRSVCSRPPGSREDRHIYECSAFGFTCIKNSVSRTPIRLLLRDFGYVAPLSVLMLRFRLCRIIFG